MDTKAAIAISSFIILTGSVTRFLVTFNQKHPTKDATCIDYGLTNVMLPTVFFWYCYRSNFQYNASRYINLNLFDLFA